MSLSSQPMFQKAATPTPMGVASTGGFSSPSRRDESIVRELAQYAGIQIGGSRPWDLQVYDGSFYSGVLRLGTLGLGESYMDGQWDAAQLDEAMTRLLRFDVDGRLAGLAGLPLKVRIGTAMLRARWLNLQVGERVFEVGKAHYDIGNELYRWMLDPTMSYSCGYWAKAEDLAQAQRDKLELICRKLDLQPGERLLDIGCGWGGLAEHAARTRGIAVTGITISREQATLARARCEGLPVDIRLQDYRDLRGRFDKIVSVGMFEHVGEKNYAQFFRCVSDLLEDEGLCLLHTIGTRSEHPINDAWYEKYIFPNGQLPNAARILQALQRKLVVEDWHNFGPDYDRTLMAWWHNVEQHWPEIEAAGYDQRFLRMWKYYLLSSAGFFRSRRGQLWQLVLSKPGRHGLYRSVR